MLLHSIIQRQPPVHLWNPDRDTPNRCALHCIASHRSKSTDNRVSVASPASPPFGGQPFSTRPIRTHATTISEPYMRPMTKHRFVLPSLVFATRADQPMAYDTKLAGLALPQGVISAPGRQAPWPWSQTDRASNANY